MKFLIHYIVRSPVKDRNFDFVWDGPVNANDLNDLRGICASDATTKKGMRSGVRSVSADEIVLAGIFPIPDGEAKQQGGS